MAQYSKSYGVLPAYAADEHAISITISISITNLVPQTTLTVREGMMLWSSSKSDVLFSFYDNHCFLTFAHHYVLSHISIP